MDKKDTGESPTPPTKLCEGAGERPHLIEIENWELRHYFKFYVLNLLRGFSEISEKFPEKIATFAEVS
jgi:hypothetical protein